MTKKGSKKSPIQARTKEQLENDIKRAQKRTFIIEQFFPALKDSTQSVDQASMLLQAITGLVMEEAMETLHTKQMKGIRGRMLKKLCPDDQGVLEVEKLLAMFDTMSLFETRGHCESMKAVIQQMQMDEMSRRNLDTFTPDWNRYLN